MLLKTVLVGWINFLLLIFKDFLIPLTNVLVCIMFDKMFKGIGKYSHLKQEMGHVSAFKNLLQTVLENLRLLEHPNGETVDFSMQ